MAALFGRDVGVLFAATGTAANSLALSALSPRYGAIYAHQDAHVVGDEGGAPEFFTQGARLVPLPGAAGKLTPTVVEAAVARGTGSGSPIPKPAALSITQATESGTVYREAEIKALAAVARKHELKVHMDGARFANAVAFLEKADRGARLADITWKAGVDALSLGLTKNGALMAEAALLFDADKATEIEWLRKRSGHVVSKAWPIAAQFLAMLENDHWLELARHANAMAAALAQGLAGAGHALGFEVEANEIFVVLPKTVIARARQDGAKFYEWPASGIAGRPASRRGRRSGPTGDVVCDARGRSRAVPRHCARIAPWDRRHLSYNIGCSDSLPLEASRPEERAGRDACDPRLLLPLQIQRTRQIAQRRLVVGGHGPVTHRDAAQGRQLEAAGDEAQDRSRVHRRVVDEAAAGERRDDDRRNARARPPAVALGRRDVVPDAAILVIGDDDQHVRPLRALLEMADDIGDMGDRRPGCRHSPNAR